MQSFFVDYLKSHLTDDIVIVSACLRSLEMMGADPERVLFNMNSNSDERNRRLAKRYLRGLSDSQVDMPKR